MRFLLSLLAICWLNIHYGQETILIQNVNVWDGTSDQLKLEQQVLTLELSPNPTSDWINLSWDSQQVVESCELRNINGQLMHVTHKL